MAGGAAGPIGSWSGSTARQLRDMDRRLARSRDMRRALRAAGREDTALERHAFPCASACLGCGWLELPHGGADPMRSETTAVPSHACPRCHRRTWIDLADVAAARALGDLERREIEVRASRFGSIALSLAAIVVVAAALGSGLSLVLGIPLALVATFAAVYGIVRMRAARALPLRAAYRWRAPALQWSEGEPFLRGAAAGEIVGASPVTGRRALAWRVEVRRVDEDRFALVEQSCGVTRIGGARLDGEVTIGLACEEVDADTPRARDYLRSRGVDPHDALVVREAIVEPARVVVVRRDRSGGPAVLCEE